ncbi:hypothetical protein FSP39_019460 [Pinctada imbricata]|uniref:Uncharacterized protein n=1 Tax=Pinctada imbricata TaxID=66713 RepID=A0AA88YVN9_PINIB|nr:hypothetical protein FSP39_019460 [Pinctada imbricata]
MTSEESIFSTRPYQSSSSLQQEVRDAVSESMNGFETLISAKLSSFEASFTERQRLINEQNMAKIEDIATGALDYTFKRKGNEAQFKHSIKVMDKLRIADNALQKPVPEIPEARQSIKEGMELLSHRQKLIKLADNSKFGWKLVEQYETHQLAEDSDDEKRIHKAEARVERMSKEDKKKKQRYGSRYAPYPVQQIPVLQTATSGKSSTVTSGPKPGLCFACGKPGHWRGAPECEAMQQKSKLSTYGPLFSSVASPVNRLHSCIAKWAQIGADEYILDVLNNGYKLPFYDIPNSVILKNNRSARDNISIVDLEILKLLEKGCISETVIPPVVVNPLTVAFNREGKARLVLDCRHINLHIFKFKFRLEDASVARYLFEIGDYAFTFDLKSAYHHISIFEAHRKYLGFAWTFQGESKVRYFVFNVLPFGVSSAAHIFTKVMRTVVKYWRNDGLKIIMYLDDGLGGASTQNDAWQVSKRIRVDLEALGFLIADDKSAWEPSQHVSWLGLLWNLNTGEVKISQARIDRLLISLSLLITQVSSSADTLVSVRRLAAIAGQVISMQVAFGSVVRMRTRYIFMCINSRASWNAPVILDIRALNELRFWQDNCLLLNGQKLDCLSNETCSSDVTVFSDASHTGYGGYIVDKPGSDVIGTWSSIESLESSTWRELVALSRVYNSLADSLEGQTIKWFTDSQNVARIMKVGSSKSTLQDIAMNVVSRCEEKSVSISTCWVPRAENKRADLLSRSCDSDDWKVTPLSFVTLDNLWGPHTVDRFATDYNTKCTRFNSRWWCPGTEQVDAFKCSWEGENNWLVPPPRFVCATVAKLKQEHAKGTLVVPRWTSAPFWPILLNYENCELNDGCITPGRGLENSVLQRCLRAGVPQSEDNVRLEKSMCSYLMQCRSNSTFCKYAGYFKKWEEFCRQKGFCPLPAEPVQFALYITSLLDAGASYSVLQSSKYAVKFMHSLHGFHDATDNAFVNNLIETGKRVSKVPTQKKDPIEVRHLHQLCDKHRLSSDLLIIRDLAMIVVAFSAFLRFDELANLHCNDIVFYDNYFSIQIRKSKTDQYRLGKSVVVSKGTSVACPYTILQKYLDLGEVNLKSEDFLFKPIFRSNEQCSLIKKNKSLSYTRVRECLVSRLKEVSGELNIGVHSLRAGGATAAANSLVNERCWKRHGRWKSDSAKDGYVADSLESRLSVSKSLNL